MLTVRETAARLGVEASNIRKWVRDGRFEGAKLEETPLGPHWLIPESALATFKRRPRGRPRKSKPAVVEPSGKRGGKK